MANKTRSQYLNDDFMALPHSFWGCKRRALYPPRRPIQPPFT